VCVTLPVTLGTCCNVNKEINIKIYVVCVCVCVCVCARAHTRMCVSMYAHIVIKPVTCVFLRRHVFEVMYSSCGSLYS